MKKVLLLLLALFSLIGLTACGDVKPKEINVDGSKADEEDLLDYMDEYEEYFKENEIDDQWYSIKFHSSVIEDEFKSTLNVSGSYFYSRFAFEQKIKLTAEYHEEYEDEDGNLEVVDKEITYVYKEGKEFCKVVSTSKTETSKVKEVAYSGQAAGEISSVLKMLDVFVEPISVLDECKDLVQTKNGFAGETEEKNYLLQIAVELDDKTYQLKELESYSNAEYNDTEIVSYLKIKTKLFGVVSTPSNPEKYN